MPSSLAPRLRPSAAAAAIAGAVSALSLAPAPAPAAAAEPRIAAFSVADLGAEIEYRIVLCAPIGSTVTFAASLTRRGGATFILPPRTGRQDDVCPTWHFREADRFARGRYVTQVRVSVDEERLRTPRRGLTLR